MNISPEIALLAKERDLSFSGPFIDRVRPLFDEVYKASGLSLDPPITLALTSAKAVLIRHDNPKDHSILDLPNAESHTLFNLIMFWPGVAKLTDNEIRATIAHELGHFAQPESNNIILQMFAPLETRRIWEGRADQFAAEWGYAKGLLSAATKVSKLPFMKKLEARSDGSKLDHPLMSDRIASLRALVASAV